MTSAATIPAWQELDREELLAFVAAMLERSMSSVDPEAHRLNVGECYLDAKYSVARARETAAQSRESAAFKAMSDAYDAWNARKNDKRYLAYVEACAAYERRRRAYRAAEKRMRAAWNALDAHWKARR